jgi:hypothetical protein
LVIFAVSPNWQKGNVWVQFEVNTGESGVPNLMTLATFLPESMPLPADDLDGRIDPPQH